MIFFRLDTLKFCHTKKKYFHVSVFFYQTDSIGIGFLVYNSDTMFPTDLGNRKVSGDIISINVQGIPEMQMLPDPVKIQFQVRFVVVVTAAVVVVVKSPHRR